MARAMSQLLGPVQAKKIGLGNKLVPEGMAGSSAPAAGGGSRTDDVCEVVPSPQPPPRTPLRPSQALGRRHGLRSGRVAAGAP